MQPRKQSCGSYLGSWGGLPQGDNWQCLDAFNVFHNWVDSIDIWFVEARNPTMQRIAPTIKNYPAQSIKQG